MDLSKQKGINFVREIKHHNLSKKDLILMEKAKGTSISIIDYT